MDQPTFSDLEYLGKKRKTRRELFLERMDGLIPWQNPDLWPEGPAEERRITIQGQFDFPTSPCRSRCTSNPAKSTSAEA